MNRPSLMLLLLGTSLSFPAAAPLRSQMIPWSQYGSVTQSLGEVEIAIRYWRPVARGRELFGSLVPWGKEWTPSADSAAVITFSGPVSVAGHGLEQGTYSIWMIPHPDEWTVILSAAARVYHTPYPEGRDVLRFTVRPQRAPHMETLAFYLPVVDGPEAELAMHWGETALRIPIAVEVAEP